MVMKRRFLSEGGRWVISVWNRGKLDKHGRTRDGANPPWAVFYDGILREAEILSVGVGIEIGMVSIRGRD